MAKKDTQEEPVSEPKAPEAVQNKDEFVQVKRSELDLLFKKLEQRDRDIEILFKSADKARLAKVQSDSSGAPLVKTVKISRMSDDSDKARYIIGWKLIKNISEIVNGRWIEDQVTKVFFDDGSDREMTLLDFSRKTERVVAEILSRTKQSEEEEVLKVLFPDGKELLISSKYVN